MSESAFIGSPFKTIKDGYSPKRLLVISPKELVFRIMTSFIPPYNNIYRKIYTDIVGPFFAIFILVTFLSYGHFLKESKMFFTPVETVISYILIMPIFFYIFSGLSKCNFHFLEVFSLVGYALYGHILTLLVSFLCVYEESNFLFFVCLIIFGGSSTLRLALIFLNSISVPAARLLVCSLISILNILYLLIFHFGYMHQTYSYGETA